jgi:hypothetical protein
MISFSFEAVVDSCRSIIDRRKPLARATARIMAVVDTSLWQILIQIQTHRSARAYRIDRVDQLTAYYE